MQSKVYDFLPEDAKTIRIKVFVDEQKFKNEFDDIEDKCLHIVLYDGEKPVATARMHPESEKTYRAGRIAVLKEYRGKGLGRAVLSAAEKEAKKHGAQMMNVLAQIRAAGFYEALGYKKTSDKEYFDEGVPHQMMSKQI